MNDIRINNLGFIFEESYENADSFLKDITYGGELYDYFFTGDFVYRGHKSNSYKLIPSAPSIPSSRKAVPNGCGFILSYSN